MNKNLINSFSKLIILVVVLFVFNSCSSGAKSKSNSKDAERALQDETLEVAKSMNTQDARSYESIVNEYRAKKYELVLEKTKIFIKKYPESRLLEQVYNLRSLTSITLKQYANALAQLKRTLEITNSRSSPDEQLVAMVTYNLAFVNFELNQLESASNYAEKVNFGALDDQNKSRLFILKAKLYRVSQEYVESLRNALLAGEVINSNSSQVKSLGSFADELLEQINQKPVLENFLNLYKNSTILDRVLSKLAVIEMQSGNRNKANEYYEQIVQKYPWSPYFGIANDNVRIIQKNSDLDSKKIGVILTLTGKYSKIGYRALQGIQLALNTFKNKSDVNLSTISIVVVDDAGEPEQAARAIEELYYKHHVIGIIGPIGSKSADIVAKRANEFGLPMISLTQKEPQPLGGYVFSAGLTSVTQVKAIVRYATEKLNIKKFSLLSPSNKFGEEYTKGFWDEVERNSGEIRAAESYPEDETDFRSYIDRMVGLSAGEARRKEIDDLKQLKAAAMEQQNLKRKNKRIDQMYELKPIVDFEAVFIPEEPKVLGQILPTFAYRDVEKVQFLGINTWNSSELIARAGNFAEGSVFVDGFYSKSAKNSVQKFIEEYRSVFGTEPNMIDAYAYDAANIMAQFVKDSSISRDDLRKKLETVNNFPGVSGPIQFQNGNFIKSLHLLGLRSGKIEEIAF